MATECDTPDTARRNTRGRAWFFTLNNPIDGDFEKITTIGAVEYGFQLEEGAEGTPHYQGYWRFSNARFFNSLTEEFDGRIHIEPVRKLAAAREYCKKTETRIDGPWELQPTKAANKELVIIHEDRIDPLEGKDLYDWEASMALELEFDPDDRTITWYWDHRGHTGKTSWCIHLAMTRTDTLFLNNSKTADALYIVSRMETPPRVILWCITRQMEGHINYGCIESLKDGAFTAGKYESRTVIIPQPHVYVFANWQPDYGALSEDRWRTIEL